MAQHILENESLEQIRETIEFFKKVGLPTKLEEIGLIDQVDEKLKRVSEKVVEPGNAIHNLPFDVTADMVYSALKNVDELESILL